MKLTRTLFFSAGVLLLCGITRGAYAAEPVAADRIFATSTDKTSLADLIPPAALEALNRSTKPPNPPAKAPAAPVVTAPPLAAPAGAASPAELKPATAPEVINRDTGTLNPATEKLVSLDLRNVDIGDVLTLFSKQYKLDIVAGKEVNGQVTISLSKVPVEEALRAILAVNGFGYIKSGGLIRVSTLRNLSLRDNQLILDAMVTRVFSLNYMSAEEIKRISDKYLSSSGTSEVVKNFFTGGWEMSGVSSSRGGGATSMGEKARKKSGADENSKTLIVTDFSNIVEKIAALIQQLDVKPSQIMIDAMIVEIGSDYVKDIGIEWDITKTKNVAYGFTTLEPPLEGLALTYEKSPLTVKIKALEEEGKADILSNPRILTLDNYAAVIMVGEKYL